VSLNGHLGSARAMLEGEPFNVNLQGRYQGRESDAAVAMAGRIARLRGLADMHLKFTVQADSLNDIGSISGFELPRDTPVAITGAVVNNGEGPQLADYVLRIGQAIIRPQAGN
jgi:hypothetical protein